MGIQRKFNFVVPYRNPILCVPLEVQGKFDKTGTFASIVLRGYFNLLYYDKRQTS